MKRKNGVGGHGMRHVRNKAQLDAKLLSVAPLRRSGRIHLNIPVISMIANHSPMQ
jgi:hypothetical protein